MSSQTFGETDLDSPGYEYLRSHRSMNNLYLKLLALNYQRDFCLLYKCPPIHRYYFSLPIKSSTEQLFTFTCLCAWLIKDKCQMNLDLSPEEYQDVDTTIGIIFEALKLLLLLDSEQDQRSVASVINFAPARLKQGFGPEVIWTISVLADRALELNIEASPGLGRAQVFFHDKQAVDAARSPPSSITIGQPIVGGGLTTRPLGNYQIDDSSLLLDDEIVENSNGLGEAHLGATDDPAQWYQQVELDRSALQAASAAASDSIGSFSINCKAQIMAAKEARRAVQEFLNQSKAVLELVANRIDRQLQIIYGREKFLQTNLREQLDEFLKHWRVYNEQSNRNIKLIGEVSSKTDLFESHLTRLRWIGSQIDARTKELNDGTKLRELQAIVDSLESESRDLDLKVNMLLMVYAKRQSARRALAEQSFSVT